MTPEQTMELILGVAGVVLQLVYKFVPAVSSWLDKFAYKGLVILALDVVVAGVLLGLACSPYAADLDISLACDQSSIFLVLKAIVLIAMQQGTFLVTKKSAPRG